MNFDAERLYNLLPAIYRIRDDEQGKPLYALLSAIAQEVAILEEDLSQLYDDQFIETCAEWVIPYIGDLVASRTIRNLGNLTPKILSTRAEVANTIAYRRRKGTASMLEQLARDVTGWDARVVEFFQLLATTQYMNHLRPQNRSWLDLRNWESLERLHTAFETIPHTLDVRRIASGRGRYNIPNIGIFLWRLNSYSLANSPAFKLDDRRYLFNSLGNNTQLFNKPETEDEITHLASPINVPMPISRRVLDRYLEVYYGEEKSLFIKVDNAKIDINQIVVCNLSDKTGGEWAHKPENKIAIDPVLGRIAFPDTQTPTDVRVIYHYGFSANMGGGEYDRADSLDFKLEPVVKVPQQYPTIQQALNAVVDGGVVEIENSDRYTENLTINVNPGKRIELRAADGFRPTIVLNSNLQITGGENAEVTINGLLISGASLQLPATNNRLLQQRISKTGGTPIPQEFLERSNKLKQLRLIHCTLVPGLSLSIDGEPQNPTSSSLIVECDRTIVEIALSILGSLQVVDSATVQISNSIVDATAEDNVAYSALDSKSAGGNLTIKNSTAIGKVHTVVMELASNTIFFSTLTKTDTWKAPVWAERRQIGCVRFCYLDFNSLVPRRYYCQPKTAQDAARVLPQFTSIRYGDPGYCQLSQRCALEIRQGADDESEIGAFHDLYQPQRETNLRVRLDEYLRFGLEAGIFYAT
ncbi:hypothetical protein [Microseira wollei]|uniref:Baseplate protein J-like domain-containing protein n=1 Tax=Microseira wollei NIES-4236 TaxID=2530354 RepID=A0AAV3XBN2_9CYAN|nr:hypothetical protein [Microseira wollei]GET39230.1 hypothetical protein MiSe_39940 [Microseira wollei NIES-4236]